MPSDRPEPLPRLLATTLAMTAETCMNSTGIGESLPSIGGIIKHHTSCIVSIPVSKYTGEEVQDARYPTALDSGF